MQSLFSKYLCSFGFTVGKINRTKYKNYEFYIADPTSRCNPPWLGAVRT
jgi:hypothetical protein